jgi:hypothetical protein
VDFGPPHPENTRPPGINGRWLSGSHPYQTHGYVHDFSHNHVDRGDLRLSIPQGKLTVKIFFLELL